MSQRTPRGQLCGANEMFAPLRQALALSALSEQERPALPRRGRTCAPRQRLHQLAAVALSLEVDLNLQEGA